MSLEIFRYGNLASVKVLLVYTLYHLLYVLGVTDGLKFSGGLAAVSTAELNTATVALSLNSLEPASLFSLRHIKHSSASLYPYSIINFRPFRSHQQIYEFERMRTASLHNLYYNH